MQVCMYVYTVHTYLFLNVRANRNEQVCRVHEFTNATMRSIWEVKFSATPADHISISMLRIQKQDYNWYPNVVNTQQLEFCICIHQTYTNLLFVIEMDS